MTTPVLRVHLATTDDADQRVEDVRQAIEDLFTALGTPAPVSVVKATILCDHCGTESPPAASVAAALDAATLTGWAHRPDGSDTCPSCTRKATP